MERYRLLLVEDDETLGYILKEYLGMNGFQVSWGKNGNEGLSLYDASPFDLLILDVMMPEKDGFELLQNIRDKNMLVPVMLLTAKTLKVDKLKGFHLGADDYVTKPVDEEVLLARIHALLRRSKNAAENSSKNVAIRFGKFLFDVDQRTLIFEHQRILVTEKESELLHLLVRNQNSILLREDALKTLWGKNDYFNRRSMDVYISNLRKLLKLDPDIKIINVHGKGYILQLG